VLGVLNGTRWISFLINSVGVCVLGGEFIELRTLHLVDSPSSHCHFVFGQPNFFLAFVFFFFFLKGALLFRCISWKIVGAYRPLICVSFLDFELVSWSSIGHHYPCDLVCVFLQSWHLFPCEMGLRFSSSWHHYPRVFFFGSVLSSRMGNSTLKTRSSTFAYGLAKSVSTNVSRLL
jgi:hypothetical protein